MKASVYFRLLITLIVMVPLKVLAQFPFFAGNEKPKGELKFYTEWVFDTSSGEKVLIQKVTYHYTKDGKLSRRFQFDTIDTNVVEQITLHNYNEGFAKNMVSDIISRYKISADRAVLVTALLDINGLIIAKKVKSKLGDTLVRFEYDHNYNLIKSISYSNKADLNFEESNRYDNNKNLLVKDRSDNANPLKTGKIICSYDLARNKTGERFYAANGHLRFSKKYEHDGHKNITDESKLSGHGSLLWKRKYTYIYDSRGNWLQCSSDHKLGSYLLVREYAYY